MPSVLPLSLYRPIVSPYGMGMTTRSLPGRGDGGRIASRPKSMRRGSVDIIARLLTVLLLGGLVANLALSHCETGMLACVPDACEGEPSPGLPCQHRGSSDCCRTFCSGTKLASVAARRMDARPRASAVVGRAGQSGERREVASMFGWDARGMHELVRTIILQT